MFGHLFDTIIVASMGGGWPHAGSSGSDLRPGLGPHCVVFLGRSFYYHSASLHPGVYMGTGKINAGGNPAID